MREAFIRAKSEKEKREKELEETKKKIRFEKASLESQIRDLKRRISGLKAEIKQIDKKISTLQKEKASLLEKKESIDMDIKELVGTSKIFAKRLESILRRSVFCGIYPKDLERVKKIAEEGYFPTFSDIKAIVDIFFHQIELSQEVGIYKSSFIDTSGKLTFGDILAVGPFEAVYRKGDEVGFLKVGENGDKLYALSSLPPWYMRYNLKRYMDGRSRDVYIDISGGGALSQIVHKLTFIEQTKKGGPIAVLILFLGIFSLAIAFERFFFLRKISISMRLVMNKVEKFLSQGMWDECLKILGSKEIKSPLKDILLIGIENREKERETLEGVLTEAISKEVPKLERFLQSLSLIAAIAPLLGLLGTVCGMIKTFHVITLFGTGDPRMMAGGISEALITTEFGLFVAIPAMFLYTLLERKVDKIIAEMEEKATSLVNTVFLKRKS